MHAGEAACEDVRQKIWGTQIDGLTLRRRHSASDALAPQLLADSLTFAGGQVLPTSLQLLTLFGRQVTEATEVVSDASLLCARQILKFAVTLANLATLCIG